ncbi:MAG TPA: uracil-DNA glycosylase [Pyrinomonadaceae bacterium]|nr:uracil-DNA glycosylase [Pyrinomonadaceae bacterium]
MDTESTSSELQSLLKQTREHLNYLQELGVTGLVIEPNEPLKQARQVTPVGAPTIQSQSKTRSIPKSIAPATSDFPVTPKPREHRTESGLSQDTLFGDLLPAAPVIEKSAETLEQIWTDLGNCTRCPLYEGRTNIVHTEGSRKARLMFIGEAPGADEDAQARPFVGRAGQLLTKMIESIGFKREDVLIGNVNRCRPPGNRAPTPDEVGACKPFLLREIASVAPDVIVVLGNTAMKNLLEVKEGITRMRGIFQEYKGVKVMPTFHPAYLLRDPSKKRETWEDLKKVRDYLENISKKES